MGVEAIERGTFPGLDREGIDRIGCVEEEPDAGFPKPDAGGPGPVVCTGAEPRGADAGCEELLPDNPYGDGVVCRCSTSATTGSAAPGVLLSLFSVLALLRRRAR
mgnify:CR=1 FL=1